MDNQKSDEILGEGGCFKFKCETICCISPTANPYPPPPKNLLYARINGKWLLLAPSLLRIFN